MCFYVKKDEVKRNIFNDFSKEGLYRDWIAKIDSEDRLQLPIFVQYTAVLNKKTNQLNTGTLIEIEGPEMFHYNYKMVHEEDCAGPTMFTHYTPLKRKGEEWLFDKLYYNPEYWA